MIAVALASLAPSRTVAAQSPTHLAVEPEQAILIQFTPDTPQEQRMVRIAALGGQLVNWIPQINVAEVRLAQPAAQVMSAAATAPEIIFIEPDMPVVGVDALMDPAFESDTTSYAFTRIQALAAWEISTGSPQVVVAVIDSGVKLDHPELAGQLVAGYDFVHKHDHPEDDSGHGTHVAGLIAAILGNNQGIAGVCPSCRIMPIKVLNANNVGTWGDLAEGIIFAANHGARIINLSLGSFSPSQTLNEAIAYARQYDVVIVAAAGNSGLNQPFYPAALDGVLAVSATSAQDGWWTLSNYGDFVDLAAPGDLVYSTYHDLDNTYGGYAFMSGTSMATPLVSGLAGLLLSLEPNLNAEDVATLLQDGAEDLGTSGRDPYYGYGRINAQRSLSLLIETNPTANPGNGAHQTFLPVVHRQ